MAKIKHLKKLSLLIIIMAAFVIMGAQCGGPGDGLTAGKPKAVTLTFWKVFEDGFNIGELTNLYQLKNSHVSISYKNFTYEEYEDELLNALAEDRGPDIFSIHNTWLNKYVNKIEPLPAELTLKQTIQQGTFKKETFTQEKKVSTLTLKDLRSLYVDEVYNKVLVNNKIQALPLSMDTLALYFNRDLLNNAKIVSPPANWDQFQEQVVKLTKTDLQGNIIQSGAALGTALNVERAADILALLMMQNGSQMNSPDNKVNFQRTPTGYSRGGLPSAEALTFYTSFAQPSKRVYTWNNQMQNSLQAFMSGQTAFFFGYSYHLPIIKAQAPKLNFEVTNMPQVSEIPINFANYWLETVSKKSPDKNEAWDFILFITANIDNNRKFLKASKKSPALRALINEQLNDLELAAFADQVLTAKSWYKGQDSQRADEIFNEMITLNLSGGQTTDKIIKLGADKVAQTY